MAVWQLPTDLSIDKIVLGNHIKEGRKNAEKR